MMPEALEQWRRYQHGSAPNQVTRTAARSVPAVVQETE